MANVLVAQAYDIGINSGSDAVDVGAIIRLRDSTGIYGWAETFTIPLKIGPLYKTGAQLNQNILDEAVEYVEGQGHTETILVRHLVGGFNTGL